MFVKISGGSYPASFSTNHFGRTILGAYTIQESFIISYTSRPDYWPCLLILFTGYKNKKLLKKRLLNCVRARNMAFYVCYYYILETLTYSIGGDLFSADPLLQNVYGKDFEIVETSLAFININHQFSYPGWSNINIPRSLATFFHEKVRIFP